LATGAAVLLACATTAPVLAQPASTLPPEGSPPLVRFLQLDFSAQRLAERRFQANVSKPKRPNLARQEKGKHKRDS
jgi:hypothetical protein